MLSHEFRDLDIGDVFYLDGRIYEKHSNYSALLLRREGGTTPAIRIRRMVHPTALVALAGEELMLDEDHDTTPG